MVDGPLSENVGFHLWLLGRDLATWSCAAVNRHVRVLVCTPLSVILGPYLGGALLRHTVVLCVTL